MLTQSAWFRPHNRDDAVGNLYFVGAGTHPGAGVPGVVGSAKATAGLILADLARRRGRLMQDACTRYGRDDHPAGSKSFAAAARLFDAADPRERDDALCLVPPLRRRDRRPDPGPRPGRRRRRG